MNINRVATGQKHQLVDFLGGGQQIAFHALHQHLHRIAVGTQALGTQAGFDPTGQFMWFNCPGNGDHADPADGLRPLALVGLAPFARRDQQHHVRRWVGTESDESFRPFLAGLARWQAHFHQSPGAEQTGRVERSFEVAPVEVTAIRVEYFSLADALRLGHSPYCVSSFQYPQHLRASNQIGRMQGAGIGQRHQPFRSDLHQGVGATLPCAPPLITPSTRRRIEAAISRRNSLARTSRSVVVPVEFSGGDT